MKKIAVILLSLLLAGIVCTAFALDVDISAMSVDELQELYTQAQTQLQLTGLQDADAYAQPREHAKYVKNPYAFKKEKITFTGTVAQVVAEGEGAAYFIAENGKASQTYHVTGKAGFAAGDEVQVWAEFSSVTSYTLPSGNTVSVPSCKGDLIIPAVQADALAGATAEELQALMEQISARIEEAQRPAGAAPESSDAYEVSAYNYDAFLKEEASFMLREIAFRGKVVQVVHSEDYDQYRVAVDEDYDCMFLVQINKEDVTTALLEEDQVTFRGMYYGLFTYTSTAGVEVTVPSCLAVGYELEDYKPAAKNVADDWGVYWISGDNYDEYARNAAEHKGEKISLFGRVLQAVESDSRENVYRIAVDEDVDRVFYVEYTLPQGAQSIKEDDMVLLSGIYYGMHTYTTTLGTKVTVPAAIAQEISAAHRTLRRGSSGDDVLKMKERLRELGYFAEGAMITRSYNETTMERVKQFQQVNGLEVTGTADSRTLALLYSDEAKPNPD